jgi:hypothetical protein
MTPYSVEPLNPQGKVSVTGARWSQSSTIKGGLPGSVVLAFWYKVASSMGGVRQFEEDKPLPF